VIRFDILKKLADGKEPGKLLRGGVSKGEFLKNVKKPY